MIKKLLNKLLELYAGRNEPETEHFAARAYWRFVIAAGCIGIISVAVYGVREFNGVIATMNASASDKPVPATSLDRAEFEKMIQAVRKRKSDFEALKANPVPLTDPSR